MILNVGLKSSSDDRKEQKENYRVQARNSLSLCFSFFLLFSVGGFDDEIDISRMSL